MNRPVGKSRHRWEDNIKMVFKKLVVKLWTAFIWLRKWLINLQVA
jgi:hypothetical protein